jgi:hypothetical protein
MAKRFSGGSVQETTQFSRSAEKWMEFVSISNSYKKIASGLIKLIHQR